MSLEGSATFKALYSTAGFSQCPAPFALNDFLRP